MINLALVGMDDDTVRGITNEVLSKDYNSEVSSFRFDLSNDNFVLQQLTMHKYNFVKQKTTS